MGRVTVVGSYIVALVMDVERIPLEGETLVGSNYHTTHGGKGSNMAACAARLGAEARSVGRVGRDALGEQFLHLLDQEGIDRSSVIQSDTSPTAVGFIVFSRKGTNCIVIDTAANGGSRLKTSSPIIMPLRRRRSPFRHWKYRLRLPSLLLPLPVLLGESSS